MQTLINTYPDSEYLAKAKLAVADSYYKEGGTSSTTQAISEYKDFITFFPFLDEAAYAQMQSRHGALPHDGKGRPRLDAGASGRRRISGIHIEISAKPFAYPRPNNICARCKRSWATANFEIARYYYLKADYRAAAARLVEVTDRYPLYSQTDEALWMLGQRLLRERN